MESQLQMEAERMADSMITSDHAEGITAFMEKDLQNSVANKFFASFFQLLCVEHKL